MTIQSMTGFGRGECTSADVTVTVEMKSVNNRYRDIRVKLPGFLSHFEIILKKRLGETFNRGSFDVYINLKKNFQEDRFEDLDQVKITAFINMLKKLAQENGVPMHLCPSDFLRTEFYQDRDESHLAQLVALVEKACNAAMLELKSCREIEGEKLVHVINDHITTFEKNLLEIEQYESHYQTEVKNRLLKRFKEFSQDLNIDEARFLQEVVYYLEKLDIHEELNRIKHHLEKLKASLLLDKEVGRQMDFLVQELNREVNTIGSKAGLNEISNAVVQMKVQLEKIREQGLNLE